MAATQLFFEDAFVFEGPAAEHLQFLICSEQKEFFLLYTSIAREVHRIFNMSIFAKTRALKEKS